MTTKRQRPSSSASKGGTRKSTRITNSKASETTLDSEVLNQNFLAFDTTTKLNSDDRGVAERKGGSVRKRYVRTGRSDTQIYLCWVHPWLLKKRWHRRRRRKRKSRPHPMKWESWRIQWNPSLWRKLYRDVLWAFWITCKWSNFTLSKWFHVFFAAGRWTHLSDSV